MKINTKKTKIIPFNFTRKYDFIPNYNIDGQKLEVVYEAKLLGVMIRSDCKWSSNTTYIVNKAKSRLWFLRRLKALGASEETLIDMFRSFVRSALEMAVPLWAGALTQADINSIERVQKVAMKMIQGDQYFDYVQSLEDLNLKSLDTRRNKICLKFAKKCVKDDKFKHWFPKKVKISPRTEEKFIRPPWNTKRYLTSSIPHLINILNKN